ncbi:MAG TPA: bifunctional 5,10-methylenetetrahydrofolate dehydrogenase/5,10-methenyltetrahydrofolate cyclohydrolase [Candidatus Paceibacterota bacterium]|nr:bifunctional 5,10-methylenetetrahydrofolate dehydrogenase/5,10-methenyltetrahydrofolate cyclohydrolase [Candidatus Paceibacterota bacterium]
MAVEILDGKKVAQEMLRDVKERAKGKSLKLAVIQVGKNKVSETYIAEKQKVGAEAGIAVQVFWLSPDITQEGLEQEVTQISTDPNTHGVIVQLPLPKHINREEVLSKIPLEKDVDVLSETALEQFKENTFPVLPPTVGAVQALFSAYGVEIRGKKVVLVGHGRLVGVPLGIWLKNQGVQFEIADKATKDLSALCRTADIIISGVGIPKLITGDMIKQGAVVIDAGTSVESGKTSGDVDFVSVSAKASFITPVPGGVGPLTVACLFHNLVTLADKRV